MQSCFDIFLQSCNCSFAYKCHIQSYTVCTYFGHCNYSPDMAVCSFKNLADESSVCGTSLEYTELHCISLKDCNRDVTRHLEFYKISNDEGVNNEMKLLLARAGMFANIFFSSGLLGLVLNTN